MTVSNDFDFDFSQSKAKKQWRKKRTYVKCMDCRALIETSISGRYPTCPFCDGANWSNDY
jgi:Zn finger protein HypA/HybF involved in hydrogenase expression